MRGGGGGLISLNGGRVMVAVKVVLAFAIIVCDRPLLRNGPILLLVFIAPCCAKKTQGPVLEQNLNLHYISSNLGNF